jgi:UDP-N-acetylglucosamine transferase subunit ALG13
VIFVTVGTHTLGFERLVAAMDAVAEGAAEEVVIQLGATQYRPRCARWFTFAGGGEIERLTGAARVVVSHAGAGAILLALRLGKPLVVMPRRKHYHEHGDDHQVELARALAQSGALLVAYETDQLAARLKEAETFQPAVYGEVSLPAAVRAALIELCS